MDRPGHPRLEAVLAGIVLLAMGAGVQIVGCTSAGSMSGSTEDAAVAADAPEAAAQEDTGTTFKPPPPGDAEDEVVIAPTYVRLANWSPDAPSSGLDLCLAMHATGAFQGPIFAQASASAADAGADAEAGLDASAGSGMDAETNADAADAETSADAADAETSADADAADAGEEAADLKAGAPGVLFPSVTAYLSLAPGSYDFRVVAPGPGGCAAGIGADVTILPDLPSYAYTTLAIVGEVNPVGADPALSIEELFDDQNIAGFGAIRFLHAAPGLPPVDLGKGTLAASSFSPLFSGVAFGALGTQAQTDGGSVDLNDYLYLSPFRNVALSAHIAAGGAVDTVTAPGFSLGAASALTIALVGGTAGGPAQLLQCMDNAPPAGLFSVCSVISR